MTYLKQGTPSTCFGCEACVQICPVQAISMREDKEGFRYPMIDTAKCIACGMCEKTCPYAHMPPQREESQYAFGGYHKDVKTRQASTSGGVFSAIVEAWCDRDYVIFGVEAKGLDVFHGYIKDKQELGKFRKSKYAQSVIGGAYRQTRDYLLAGKKVLFSGTPCQIAGLLSYLNCGCSVPMENLLTVEVICEGVPSPLYVRKMDDALQKCYGHAIDDLDYRYKGRSALGHGKWDFQQMRITCGNRVKTQDRWFNPFWSVWLKHYMSRPSCYECPFAKQARVADLTLGDLWGVHLYCPELYGKNGGASLAVANTSAGKNALWKAEKLMYGHELKMEDVLKYQSPMRKHIDPAPERESFMVDLESDMDYQTINRKWASRPTFKLLWSKYIWGNRQKVLLWNLKRQWKGEKTDD